MPAATNKAWEEFVAWCQSRGLRAVPANPWTLAAFIRACEERHSLKTLEKLLQGINRVHAEKTRKRLDHHPLVQRTMRMIENKAASREHSAELFDDDDFLNDNPAPKKPRQPAPHKTKPCKPKPQKKVEKPKLQVVLDGTPRLVSRRRLKR